MEDSMANFRTFSFASIVCVCQREESLYEKTGFACLVLVYCSFNNNVATQVANKNITTPDC